MQGSHVRSHRRVSVAVALSVSLLATLVQAVPTAAQTSEPEAVPSGKIVFDGVRGNDRDVLVANADGSGEVNLTPAEPAGDVDATFAPDATAIAFASCRHDGIQENLQCELLPSVNPGVGDSNVFVMGPDGSGQIQLTTNLQNDGEPDLHDGRIAFVSHRNLNFEIYTMNVDGSGVTRLTNDGNIPGVADRQPSWSPDGARVAWARGGDIWVMNANGSGQAPVTAGGATDANPAWSPDGSRIAFTRNSDIWTMNADGSGAAAVVTGSSVDREPAWSPDGEWIAFSSDRDGDFEIHRVPSGGGDVVQVTSNSVADGAPDWVDDLSLSADVETTTASPASIPLSRIPLQPGAPASDPATAPIKLDDLGLSPIKLDDLGLSPIKLDDLGLAAPAVLEGLRHVPLSSVPLIPPLSWEAVLDGCTSEPVHNLSLGDILELDCDVSSIEWKDIDLTQPPFGGLDFVSLLLGDQPIGTISGQVDTDDDGEVDSPVAPSSYWCPRLEAKGFASCGDDAGDLDATAVDLQIAGVSFTTSPLIPLMTFPLGNVEVDANPTSPLRSIRVAAFDMQTLIGAIHVAELPDPDAIVDCSSVDCSDPELRLVDVAGDIRPDARLGAMLGDGSPVEDLALGDIVYGLLGDFPIETIPFSQLGILGWGGDGSRAVRYALRYSPVAIAGVDSGTVSVTLPDTFFFDSASPEPADVSGNVLTWDVAGLEAGEAFEAEILARPGVGLGSRTTAANASGDAATIGGGTAPFDRSNDVTVDVTDTFEPNDSEGEEIEADVLHVSFTPEGDGVDTFLLPAPEAGSDVQITLAHQTVDRDLIVCAPPDAEAVTPLRRPKSNVPAEPLLPDAAAGFDNAGTALGPDQADDLPIPGDCALEGLSQHRDDSDEFVRTTASGTGSYRILVAPYLGVSSGDPYTLHVKVSPPPDLGPCEEPSLAPSALHGTMPAALAPGTTTLVLANENRMRRALGDAGAQAVIAKLAELEADPVVGEGTAVLYVDGDPDVVAASAALDAEPCSPEARNDLVRAVNDTVDDLVAASPVEAEDIEAVAVIGDPRIIPQGLVPDRTRWGNERSYAQSIAAASGHTNDAGITAAAFGLLPTDNPFGDVDPTKVAGGWSYRPDQGVGRLVGSADDIVGSLDRVIDSGGTIDPGTAKTFATDFMTDTGTTVDADVDAALGAQPEAIGESWTVDDLRQAALSSDPADLFTLLAHMDHRRALPPGSPGSLLDASEVEGAAGIGDAWITMGCHSGYLTPGTPHWADAVAGRGVDLYVAETGYGLGSRNGIALSEAITVEFVRNILAGQLSGLALANARGAVLEAGPVLGVYEEKAVEEATLYGWPGLEIPQEMATPVAATSSASASSTTVDHTLTPEFQLNVTPEGTKFYSVDGRAHGPQHRPLLPVVPLDVAQEGLEARGWTIEALTSADELNFPSTPAQNLLSGAGVTPPDAPFGFVAAPAVPARITPSQKLVFAPALFQGDPQAGLHRRYIETTLRVHYGDPTVEGTAPSFAEAEIVTHGSEADGFTADFIARVTDAESDVSRVTVLYHDEGNVWSLVELVQDGTDPELWTLEGVPFDGPGIEGMYFAVDSLGYSATTSSKALYFGGEFGPPSSPDEICLAEIFPPDRGEVKAGSTLPVKFTLLGPPDCTSKVRDIGAVKEIRSYVVGSSGPVRQEDLSSLTAPSETDDFYKFEWSTDKNWSGEDVVLEIVTRDERVKAVAYTMN